ncbi:helix-turn-helix domain-containing protein [Priestia filamentosa]|uniref:DNA-binding protein n=1 Tax=Priestia filamentosa TaxID=1402861 RepID=UPI003983D9E6
MSFEESIREIFQQELEKFKQSVTPSPTENDWLSEYPNMLTTAHVREILGIKQTKMSELMNRSDFPVFKLAGTRIPKHKFIIWIENNTRWIEDNTQSNRKII